MSALRIALTLAMCTSFAHAVLPAGAACTTTIHMVDAPPEECAIGLACILVDAGDEARDVPNAGFCLEIDTRLPVDHACSASTVDCAPTLSCSPRQNDVSEGTCRKCPCGSTCTMLGGSIGTCGEDGTCANFLVAIACPVQAEEPLETGDVCKSGGPETGPGVMREYDCPVGSVCLPKPDVFAIGGEVPFTCQSHEAPLPEFGICSPSGSLLFPAVLCQDGLDCVIVDAGRPELDVPSIGICMIAGSVLPVGAECQPETDALIAWTPCAPKLSCVWPYGAAPPENATGYICQPVNSEHNDPPMLPPGDENRTENVGATDSATASGVSFWASLTAFLLTALVYHLQ